MNKTRIKIDCNWIVKDAAKLRREIMAKRLSGVQGLEPRLAVKIEVQKMTYRELVKVSKV